MQTGSWIFSAVFLLTSAFSSAQADQFQVLLNGLQSADSETALKAIAELGRSGDIGAVPPLLAALRDERPQVRQYAVEALQYLARLLDSAHFVVKWWLQLLIDQLQLGPADDMITVERPVVQPPML